MLEGMIVSRVRNELVNELPVFVNLTEAQKDYAARRIVTALLNGEVALPVTIEQVRPQLLELEVEARANA
jgi:hypothetical protein